VLVESADISDDGAAAALPAAQAATPWQARVDLMLDLLHSD
jgi:hypothetical protein